MVYVEDREYERDVPCYSPWNIKFGTTTVTKELMVDLRALGICSPSPMDFEKGLICNPCNMNGWIDVPIRDYLGKAFET